MATRHAAAAPAVNAHDQSTFQRPLPPHLPQAVMRRYAITYALRVAPDRNQARALGGAGWVVCPAGCCATLRITARSGGAAARTAPTATPAEVRGLVGRPTGVCTPEALVDPVEVALCRP